MNGSSVLWFSGRSLWRHLGCLPPSHSHPVDPAILWASPNPFHCLHCCHSGTSHPPLAPALCERPPNSPSCLTFVLPQSILHPAGRVILPPVSQTMSFSAQNLPVAFPSFLSLNVKVCKMVYKTLCDPVPCPPSAPACRPTPAYGLCSGCPPPECSFPDSHMVKSLSNS